MSRVRLVVVLILVLLGLLLASLIVWRPQVERLVTRVLAELSEQNRPLAGRVVSVAIETLTIETGTSAETVRIDNATMARQLGAAGKFEIIEPEWIRLGDYVVVSEGALTPDGPVRQLDVYPTLPREAGS